MSPRKSSTSSGKRADRPRYLAVEVAGVPISGPRAFEAWLAVRLVGVAPPVSIRLIRADGSRGLVEVPHAALATVRAAWNSADPSDGSRLRTFRTYGTLRKGKAWLAGLRSKDRVGRRASSPAPTGD